MIVRTATVKHVERAHKGRPIEEIVPEARRKWETTQAAATALGVSVNTFRAWERSITEDLKRVNTV